MTVIVDDPDILELRARVGALEARFSAVEARQGRIEMRIGDLLLVQVEHTRKLNQLLPLVDQMRALGEKLDTILQLVTAQSRAQTEQTTIAQ